jgi:hypothetical protein
MDIHPIKFEASIGGFFGQSYEVKLQSDGSLHYFQFPDMLIQMPDDKDGNDITVSDSQWREFRKALDSANIWQWKKYYDSYVMDGTQWEVRIKYKDASIHSGGSNNYPPGKEFEQFREAVINLIGGRKF